MRKHLNWSLKEIAKSLNRDHTTVIHSLRNYQDYLLNEEVFQSTNKAIEEAVLNRRCPVVYKIGTSRYEKYHSQVLEVS
jgi:IS30 family transposase